MESYLDNTPLWDLSHASNFSQLEDSDFLALLQKQFPNGTVSQDPSYVDGVNPQNISRYSLPSMTPPSEDSSPSPPNTTNEQGVEDGGDPALKRKASDGDFEQGPSSKSQHTGQFSLHDPLRWLTRCLMRSEHQEIFFQHSQKIQWHRDICTSQRAFRERKEKHVKDLEDKVAALEAKNEAAQSENENLRDLLTRLQHENLSLKQSSFTFAVPKNGSSTSETPQASTSFASQSPAFVSSSSSGSVISPNPSPAKLANPLEWSSLTTFDPAMLSLLDDTPQPTATDGAMAMDFGFGSGMSNTGLSPIMPFTTIASNPMFMSFASSFDTPIPEQGSPFHNFEASPFSSWSSPSTIPSSQDTSTLDDLLAGYLARSADYSSMSTPLSTASDSPITHHPNTNNKNSTSHSPAAFSSQSSPSSTISDPLFDSTRDSSVSDSEIPPEVLEQHQKGECPRTKGELAQRIASSGPSPFAPPTIRKTNDSVLGNVITCEGTSLPKTQKSDQNIEVLSAWRSITSNPRFKDIDINNLCSEFTAKAKCDGSKVVLEPQGVNHIIQNLSSQKK
ncbi:hypothetical protein H0H81_004300 [Sphagnurus paluster]|uniref:BZIP domain-containing protein n=1 Tax=Sphagnurus paluster TaxID=117069 RepID=A0A9P7KPC0_9AGAR|nr:hypothetical protein H0H81_004300 [Sphagnurus paluster]